MKAEELMVGDLVICNSHPDKPCYIRFCIGDFQKYLYQTCEPIPLTEEILKDNGFYFGYTTSEEDVASNTIADLSEEDKGWVWDEGAGAVKVIFPNESDGGMIIIDDQSFDRHLTFVFVNDIYVHELQHAMRMCGINKEITL